MKMTSDVRDQSYSILEFHGELDSSNLSNAESEIANTLANFSRPAVIFDFTNLHYINSDGIGLIMTMNTRMKERHVQLIVAGARPNVKDVLEIMGLHQLLPVVPTVEDAKTKIQK